jgi:hypothetical protein
MLFLRQDVVVVVVVVIITISFAAIVVSSGIIVVATPASLRVGKGNWEREKKRSTWK